MGILFSIEDGKKIHDFRCATYVPIRPPRPGVSPAAKLLEHLQGHWHPKVPGVPAPTVASRVSCRIVNLNFTPAAAQVRKVPRIAGPRAQACPRTSGNSETQRRASAGERAMRSKMAATAVCGRRPGASLPAGRVVANSGSQLRDSDRLGKPCIEP